MTAMGAEVHLEGKRYRVLPDDDDPTPAGAKRQQHKNEFTVPIGWRIVSTSDANFEQVRIHVIKPYEWSTHVLAVLNRDGAVEGYFSRYEKNKNGAKASAPSLTHVGGATYKFSGTSFRLLIVEIFEISICERISELELTFQARLDKCMSDLEAERSNRIKLEASLERLEAELEHERANRATKEAEAAARYLRRLEVMEHGRSAAAKEAADALAAAEVDEKAKEKDYRDIEQIAARNPLVDITVVKASFEDAKALTLRQHQALEDEDAKDREVRDVTSERLNALEEKIGNIFNRVGKRHRSYPDQPATNRMNSNDDLTDTSYKSLPIEDFKNLIPTKSLDEYVRTDVMSIPEFQATTSKYVDKFLDEVNKVARDKIQNEKVLEKFPKLSENSVKALAAFTIELQMAVLDATQEDEFYRQYGQVVRKRAPLAMRKLAGYSHFLFHGLMALPEFKGTLWRGIRGRKAVLLALRNYNIVLKEIVWSSIASGSSSREVSKAFALEDEVLDEDSKDDDATFFPGVRSLLFRLEVEACARQISHCSAIVAEHESTILPNTTFLITKLAHAADDSMLEIHLSEKPDATFKF